MVLREGFAKQQKGTDMDSHLWFLTDCAVILAIGAPVPHNSISSPAATGSWHHNPQIYFTKAVGEVLIPNPCESIHFSLASSHEAHRQAVQVDKDGTCRANTRWDGAVGRDLLEWAWAAMCDHLGAAKL